MCIIPDDYKLQSPYTNMGTCFKCEKEFNQDFEHYAEIENEIYCAECAEEYTCTECGKETTETMQLDGLCDSCYHLDQFYKALKEFHNIAQEVTFLIETKHKTVYLAPISIANAQPINVTRYGVDAKEFYNYCIELCNDFETIKNDCFLSHYEVFKVKL